MKRNKVQKRIYRMLAFVKRKIRIYIYVYILISVRQQRTGQINQTIKRLVFNKDSLELMERVGSLIVQYIGGDDTFMSIIFA